MAVYVRNMDELAKAMQPVLLKMVDQLADRVYETLNYFLEDYYSGYEPSSYQRTKDFLYSAVKVDAQPYRGDVRASVYIDTDAMDSYRNVSGYQVADFFNTAIILLPSFYVLTENPLLFR